MYRMMRWLVVLAVIGTFSFGTALSVQKTVAKLKVTSTAFKDGDMIPPKYTADGANVSPPLTIKDIPSSTKSLALICDDPDAPRGTFVHWVIYNWPAKTDTLPENIPPKPKLANGALQGKNDFGNIGYGGPAPPSGTHRYYFKVYALDVMLNLKSGATKSQLEDAMKGHVLARGQLMGRYSRK